MRVDVIDRDFDPGNKEPFSVCMTVKDEGDAVIQFLLGLAEQTRWPSEVVVVDGGSTDGSMDKMAEVYDVFPLVRLISAPGLSPAAGRNLAARAATHELQATVDAGCILHPRYFANVIGPMCEPDPPDIAAGIYGPIRSSQYARYFIPNWANIEHLKRNFLPSCRAMAIRRSLMERAGWFPEQLKQRWGEDSLFMLEAKKLSRRWVINRNAMVKWDAPATLEEAKGLAYRYGMGNGEIGDERYYAPDSDDPVLIAAAEGYRFGAKLRMQAVQ